MTVESGRFVVSADPHVELVTFALGSCVSVIVHDPERVAGGMIHFRLPHASADMDKARSLPGTYGDIGIQALFAAMLELGCDKRDWVVKLAGGAAMNGDHERFDIGARNIVIARRVIWQSRLLIAAESVAGSIPRTVYLDVANGRCVIRSGNEEFEL